MPRPKKAVVAEPQKSRFLPFTFLFFVGRRAVHSLPPSLPEICTSGRRRTPRCRRALLPDHQHQGEAVQDDRVRFARAVCVNDAVPRGQPRTADSPCGRITCSRKSCGGSVSPVPTRPGRRVLRRPCLPNSGGSPVLHHTHSTPSLLLSAMWLRS